MDYLLSKLTAPHCNSKIVKREQIFAILDNALNGESLFLSAPAGYGKTVALSCWIKIRNISCAWYSLENTDNNPLQFIRHFAKSINLAYPDFKAGQFENINDIRSGFDHLFIYLQKFNRKLLLVLDDFHCISNTYIINFINRLIVSNMFSIIVTSRHELNEVFEESLLRQRITYIDKNVLLFRKEDIRRFLNNKNISYNDNTVSDLFFKSEGWALAVVSLSYDIEYHSSTTSLKGQKYIKGFLKRQLWDNLNDEERNLIKHTAVLNEFTAEAAEALTGYKNAKAIINSLMKKCLFLSFINSDGEWYRYHHLIGEFITEQLSSKNDVIKNYNIIAKYFYEKSDIIKSVEYYNLAGNKKEILNIIINNPEKILILFEPKKVVLLVDSLKEYGAFEYINVLVCYGWAMQQIRKPYEAYRFIKNLSNYLVVNKDNISVEMNNKIMLEIAAMSLPFNVADKNINGVINSLEMMSRNISNPLVYNFDTVQALYESEYTLRDTISGFYGRHHLMMDTLEAIKLPGHENIYNFFVNQVSIVVSCAEILYELNRVKEASDLLVKYMDKAIQNTKLYMPAMICLSNIQKYKGDFNGAYNTIEKCSLYLNEKNDYMAADTLMAYKARLDCLLQDYKSIKEWEKNCALSPYDDVSDISRHSLYKYLTYVNILITFNQYDSAKILVGKLLTMLDKLPDLVYKSQVLYFDALLAYADGDTNADYKFSEMLSLGYSDGYYTTFTDFGPEFNVILHKFNSNELSPEHKNYIGQLNEISSGYCIHINQHYLSQNTSLDITGKERKILELLSGNHSNQEIADIMFVSLQTIKNKTSIIYKKLGVNKRTEAVLKARQIGIL